jgi:predicted NACHT family NTPase
MFGVPIGPNYKPYSSVAEALVETNPHLLSLRKALLPETVKQAPAVESSINIVKYLGKKCGIKIDARFPEDIAKYVTEHEKRLKYLKKNNYSEALKQFFDIFVAHKKQINTTDEFLLNLKLMSKGNKILERFNLKKLKF